jgi:hypothetical protein
LTTLSNARLISGLVLALFMAPVTAGAQTAGDATAPQTGADAQAAPADAAPPYDPRPFLTSMVDYRLIAFSCEQVLPGSPLSDSSEIAQFFIDLGQQPPVGTDARMDRIIYQLIRPQSASICTERLRRAALAYSEEAAAYEGQKPDGWPPAPRISAGPWCQDLSCADVR